MMSADDVDTYVRVFGIDAIACSACVTAVVRCVAFVSNVRPDGVNSMCMSYLWADSGTVADIDDGSPALVSCNVDTSDVVGTCVGTECSCV